MEKYAYLIELLVSTGSHVLLRGEEGCGKTSLIKVWIPHIISSSYNVQYISHLRHSSKGFAGVYLTYTPSHRVLIHLKG